MLVKSKKQKGKQLEKFVAGRLGKIYKFAYSRADSGSGKYKKEDVTLPDDVPLFIECKNHAEMNFSSWWRQTLNGCPASKLPVLVYKLNYQTPKVALKLNDLLYFLFQTKISVYNEIITLDWVDFENILLKRYAQNSNTSETRKDTTP